MQNCSALNSAFGINIDQLVKNVVRDIGIEPSDVVSPTVLNNDDDDVVFIKSVEADTSKTNNPSIRKRGSVIKIEICAKRVLREVKKEPSSEVPTTVPSDDDDIVFVKSVNADKHGTANPSHGKEGDSDNEVEIIAESGVWDVKRKVTVGKCDDSSLDVVFLDGASSAGSLEQSNAPQRLMMFSQSSDNTSTSKGRVIIPGEVNLNSSMEIDIYDDYCSTPEETVSVEPFEFSDDENEDGETIEHFLFKASLVLRKLKYRNESEIQIPEDSALLNITGSIKNEETDEDGLEIPFKFQ